MKIFNFCLLKRAMNIPNKIGTASKVWGANLKNDDNDPKEALVYLAKQEYKTDAQVEVNFFMKKTNR